VASKRQITIARLMATVAVCAGVLTILRYAPEAVVCAGPLIGSLWGIRKGEKGFIGGVMGGLVTGSGIGLAVTWYHYRLGSRGPIDFVDCTFFGAILGICVGAVVWLAVVAARVIRYLADMPRSIRLRAYRRANASPFGLRPPRPRL
jgi:hypothetical protein